MLWKVAAGAAALVIAAGLACHAETAAAPAAGTPAGDSPAASDAHGSLAADHAAFVSARAAALHAGLQLTPEQDKAWPAFETAYREVAEVRHQRFFHHHDGDALDPLQRAQRRADALAAGSVASRHYADALAPLYQSLDDGQKRRFALLQHFGHPRFQHVGFRHGDDARGDFHGDFHHGEFHHRHGDFHHGEFHHGDAGQ